MNTDDERAWITTSGALALLQNAGHQRETAEELLMSRCAEGRLRARAGVWRTFSPGFVAPLTVRRQILLSDAFWIQKAPRVDWETGEVIADSGDSEIRIDDLRFERAGIESFCGVTVVESATRKKKRTRPTKEHGYAISKITLELVNEAPERLDKMVRKTLINRLRKAYEELDAVPPHDDNLDDFAGDILKEVRKFKKKG